PRSKDPSRDHPALSTSPEPATAAPPSRGGTNTAIASIPAQTAAATRVDTPGPCPCPCRGPSTTYGASLMPLLSSRRGGGPERRAPGVSALGPAAVGSAAWRG